VHDARQFQTWVLIGSSIRCAQTKWSATWIGLNWPMRWKHRDNRSAKLPLKTELILMSSGGGVGPYRSDMQDRHADVSQARPTSELLVMLCLSSVRLHHRLQRASQCAKWRVPSIKDEFAEGLSVVKVNLHQISYQPPRCNQTSLRVKCHLLPFRHCLGFGFEHRGELSWGPCGEGFVVSLSASLVLRGSYYLLLGSFV